MAQKLNKNQHWIQTDRFFWKSIPSPTETEVKLLTRLQSWTQVSSRIDVTLIVNITKCKVRICQSEVTSRWGQMQSMHLAKWSHVTKWTMQCTHWKSTTQNTRRQFDGGRQNTPSLAPRTLEDTKYTSSKVLFVTFFLTEKNIIHAYFARPFWIDEGVNLANRRSIWTDNVEQAVY